MVAVPLVLPPAACAAAATKPRAARVCFAHDTHATSPHRFRAASLRRLLASRPADLRLTRHDSSSPSGAAAGLSASPHRRDRRLPALESAGLLERCSPIWVFLAWGEHPGPLVLAGGTIVVGVLALHAIATARRYAGADR
jgi:hypothetical protein